jgi:hypothetical protein
MAWQVIGWEKNEPVWPEDRRPNYWEIKRYSIKILKK